MVAQQVDDSFNQYKNRLEAGTKLSFMPNCYSSLEYSLTKDETWIKPLNPRHQIILRLSFLLKDNGQVIFSKDFFSLSRHNIISPLKIGENITSIELEKQIKHSYKKKINNKECKCKEERERSLKNETLEEVEEKEINELKEEILNEEELGELIRINSKINYLIINEEHI